MELRLQGHALDVRPAGPAGRFGAVLPAGAAGQWCRLAVSVAHTDATWWVKLEAADEARGHVVREAFLGRQHRSAGRTWRTILVHLPYAADRLTLQVFTATLGQVQAPLASLHVLRRGRAAAALLASGWPALPRALAGDARGLAGRVRAMLGQRPARRGEAPPYDIWVARYDDWRPLRNGLTLAVAELPVDVAVIGQDDAGLRATLESLRAQWVPPASIDVFARPGDWRARSSAWVLVMQAGEVLAPHGLACLADAARRDPDASGFYADLDCITANGRANPLFKPQPDPWLLRSGLLTRGACLFRASTLLGAGEDAAAWRTAAACSTNTAVRSVPFILTHVPNGQVAATNAPVPGCANSPLVSVVVPTSARHGHMLRCLRAILARTDYENIEILLAVSCVDAGDERQAANLAEAARLPTVRVLDLQMAAFNYAAINNAAVRQARGELILLLNDDVLPTERDWLRRMVAFVAGAFHVAADIVGARLLYGNGLVQHGGVTLGLANLCEHSFRLSENVSPGPHGLAMLNRQVSAVTAACMLLRRSLFETLHGMDEAFSVALNDVDFCLRASQLGARTVLAAEVTLIHYESLSLGRHYQGKRAGLEALEVRRLRERWAGAIAADPFYSPSASLEPGREFQPGFPPRATPDSWWQGSPAAST